MTPVRCFLLEDAGKLKRYLRRYHDGECPAPWKPFGGMTLLDEIPHAPRTTETLSDNPTGLVARDDPRWPRTCECGREFTGEDHWQIFTDTVYRADTGEEFSLRTAPPGAMWDAWWYGDAFRGPDGKSMVVVCPGGHQWLIDGRASNCTMPNDSEHRCWIRHGEPPNLTVDKNGKTCAAGAGSIQTSNWHGFLRNGFLAL